MSLRTLTLHDPWLSLLTLAIGACGAMVAYLLSMPAAILIGPALAVSLSCLAGLRLGIATLARDVCFVVLGIGIGAGFDPSATAAILRWPLAFVALGVALLVTLMTCQWVLIRGFGFDRRTAILAATPGHLSFVLGLASDLGADSARVAVVQTIRLLALTLSVPFAALAMGFEIGPVALPFGETGQIWHLLVLTVFAVATGLIFKRIGLPAPLLLGALVVSALGHMSNLTPGTVPAYLLGPAFLMLGSLIGTRFSGMSPRIFAASLLAGLSTTLIAVIMASAAAIPVAIALGMPAAHVLAAFAPGGLETMIALGATMGASPGFIAACHIARLLILSVVVPLAVRPQKT